MPRANLCEKHPHPPTRLFLPLREWQVMGAQHLPKRAGSGSDGAVPSPFCSVIIYGDPLDTAKLKTRTVPGNGFNPVWDESFSFELQRPETAVLYIAGALETSRGFEQPATLAYADVAAALCLPCSTRPTPCGRRDGLSSLLCCAPCCLPCGL